MKIGDTIMACPMLLYLEVDNGKHKPIPWKVIFIHPEKRFYVLEFYFRKNYVRESFNFPAEIKEEGRDYANYCDYERQRRRRKDRYDRQRGRNSLASVW